MAMGQPHGLPLQDPWISLTDHSGAIAEGNILYGENNFAGAHADTVLPDHLGANVFCKASNVQAAP